MKRTLGAGLGLGAVNALLALLAVHLFRTSELGGLGWFGGSADMPRRYADSVHAAPSIGNGENS